VSGGPCLVVCWTRYLHDRDPSAHSPPRVYRLGLREDAEVLVGALDDLCDDLAGDGYKLVARAWPPAPGENEDPEVRAAAEAHLAAQPRDGAPGVRDPNAPCADYDPVPRAEGSLAPPGECEGDGHYLCAGCAWHAPPVNR
jgi:hypothetical protein